MPDDPTPRLKSLDPSIAAAVRESRITPGMAKADVLLARGYPPFHHTAGVEADRWTYYESPILVDVVDFVDGRVTTVTRAGAPRQ